MFKKISLFLVLALVIGALSACSPLNTQVVLTDDLKAEIERAYIAAINAISLTELGKGNDVYLGTVDDTDLLSLQGVLYGYQNGSFILLEGDTKSVAEQVMAGAHTIPTTASQERLAEIEVAWQKWQVEKYYSYPRESWVWMQEKDSFGDAYCYGTYDGYYIFLRDKGLTAASSETIGDVDIHYMQHFSLCTYKDGKVHNLRELYEQGAIPLSVIKAVAKQNEERFPLAYLGE